jgi:uncharacterized protein YjeT (DUF2065 family)
MRLLISLLPAVALMLVLEGVPYFASPTSARKFLAFIAGRPEWMLRLFGFVLIASGLFALWMAQDLRTMF